jgi:hypothetical protein
VKAWTILAYTFDGDIYHPTKECLGNPDKCTCKPSELDEQGFCKKNCHGYGPTPVFNPDDLNQDEVCGSCSKRIIEED